MVDDTAQAARDRILDQIVAGETEQAIRAYREATGAGPADAERILLRLEDILQSTRELNAKDKRFLDDFRAGLKPGSLFDLIDRPHLSLPKQLAALASYVALTVLTLNAVGALILLITGSLAHWVNPWLGFTLSLLLAGSMFIAFPGILRGLVVRRLGIGSFVRSPGFGWEIALGFVLLISGILGTGLSERLVWLARSQVVELESPDELGRIESTKSAILHIDSSQVQAEPVGTLVKARRDRHGTVTRSEYLVKPLVADHGEAQAPTPSELCWWVGQADSSVSRMQHPILDPDAESPYFVVSPTHRGDYDKAVANALGGAEVPACVQVLERVPPPGELRRALMGKLRTLAVTVNVALWVLLGIWGAAWVVRRLRSATASPG
ncbi:MAG: hypothetical protein AAF657_27760 [Acidobacteriota bacterium]